MAVTLISEKILKKLRSQLQAPQWGRCKRKNCGYNPKKRNIKADSVIRVLLISISIWHYQNFCPTHNDKEQSIIYWDKDLSSEKLSISWKTSSFCAFIFRFNYSTFLSWCFSFFAFFVNTAGAFCWDCHSSCTRDLFNTPQDIGAMIFVELETFLGGSMQMKVCFYTLLTAIYPASFASILLFYLYYVGWFQLAKNLNSWYGQTGGAARGELPLHLPVDMRIQKEINPKPQVAT